MLFGIIKWSGTGNCEHSSKASFPICSISVSFSMFSAILFISSAIFSVCSCFIPRGVIAAVPIRSPLGSNGGAGSLGMELQLVTMFALFSAFANFLPGIFLFLKSISIRWLSVPPETSLKPNSSSFSAKALEFLLEFLSPP